MRVFRVVARNCGAGDLQIPCARRKEAVGLWEGVAFEPESREARRVFRSIPVGIDRVAQRRIAAFWCEPAGRRTTGRIAALRKGVNTPWY